MKNKAISLKAAKEQAEIEIGRPIQSHGFASHEVGGSVVNTLFYRYRMGVEGNLDLGYCYRWKIWVNGKQAAGGIID